LAELLTIADNQSVDMDKNTQPAEELNNDGNVAAEMPANEQVSEKDAGQTNEKQNEVGKLQGELAEAKDKYLRLYSEFENFRRRTSKEKLEMVLSANEELLKAILPVADDFERAEKSFREKNDKDAEGFLLIQNKLKKVLEQYGVKVMDIKTGADFDPDFHEAITQVPAPEPALQGKIMDVVEKGYLLKDKVIRYAKVVVGN
jgi:molecular chaperone GrpE